MSFARIFLASCLVLAIVVGTNAQCPGFSTDSFTVTLNAMDRNVLGSLCESNVMPYGSQSAMYGTSASALATVYTTMLGHQPGVTANTIGLPSSGFNGDWFSGCEGAINSDAAPIGTECTFGVQTEETEFEGSVECEIVSELINYDCEEYTGLVPLIVVDTESGESTSLGSFSSMTRTDRAWTQSDIDIYVGSLDLRFSSSNEAMLFVQGAPAALGHLPRLSNVALYTSYIETEEVGGTWRGHNYGCDPFSVTGRYPNNINYYQWPGSSRGGFICDASDQGAIDFGAWASPYADSFVDIGFTNTFFDTGVTTSATATAACANHLGCYQIPAYRDLCNDLELGGEGGIWDCDLTDLDVICGQEGITCSGTADDLTDIMINTGVEAYLAEVGVSGSAPINAFDFSGSTFSKPFESGKRITGIDLGGINNPTDNPDNSVSVSDSLFNFGGFLTSLELNDNQIDNLPVGDARKATFTQNIELLDVSNNLIDDVTNLCPYDFETNNVGEPQSRVFDFSGNDIDAWSACAFGSAEEDILVTLDLSENGMTDLSGICESNIEILDVHDNDLTELPSCLRDQPLTEFYAHSNDLRQIYREIVQFENNRGGDYHVTYYDNPQVPVSCRPYEPTSPDNVISPAGDYLECDFNDISICSQLVPPCLWTDVTDTEEDACAALRCYEYRLDPYQTNFDIAAFVKDAIELGLPDDTTQTFIDNMPIGFLQCYITGLGGGAAACAATEGCTYVRMASSENVLHSFCAVNDLADQLINAVGQRTRFATNVQPENPYDEGPLRPMPRLSEYNTEENYLNQLRSPAIKPQFCNLGSDPFFIDRTSWFANSFVFGQLLNSENPNGPKRHGNFDGYTFFNEPRSVSCQQVNYGVLRGSSNALRSGNWDSIVFAGEGSRAPMLASCPYPETEMDRNCARLAQSILCALMCPPYGGPQIGVCAEEVEFVYETCGDNRWFQSHRCYFDDIVRPESNPFVIPRSFGVPCATLQTAPASDRFDEAAQMFNDPKKINEEHCSFD